MEFAIKLNNKKNSRDGAAIVELALAMVLLFGFILFSLFIGRVLSERCRMLAASRTLSWIVTHQKDGKDGKLPGKADANFLRLMRAWHFKDQGIAAGIVRLKSDPDAGWGSGMLVGSEENAQKIKDLSKQSQDSVQESTIATNSGEGTMPLDSSDTNKYTSGDQTAASKGNNTFAAGASSLANSFSSFLFGDFKFYDGMVEYGMPMIVSKSAYEWLWGSMSGDGSLTADEQQLATPGQTYVFLKPFSTGCVFPLIEPGDPLTDSKSMLSDLMKSVKDQLDRKDAKLYRPHRFPPHSPWPYDNPLPEISNRKPYDASQVADMLEALLIYEYDYDPNQDKAMKLAEE